MGNCCRDNNQSKRKIKEWGNENSQNKSIVKPILLITGLLLIGLAGYKFII